MVTTISQPWQHLQMTVSISVQPILLALDGCSGQPIILVFSLTCYLTTWFIQAMNILVGQKPVKENRIRPNLN